MRETTGRNASRAAEVKAFARQHSADLHAIELDVASQESVNARNRRGLFPETTSSMWWCASADHDGLRPRRPLRRSNWPSFTIPTSWARSGQSRRAAAVTQAGPGPAGVGSSSGARGGTPPYLVPISPPRRRWTPSRSAMPANSRAGESKPPSSCLISTKEPTLRSLGRPAADAVRAEEYADGPTADISEIMREWAGRSGPTGCGSAGASRTPSSK